LGPNVSIFGGDHYFNSVEYRINQIGDAQKPHWCDLDVEIKGDCWIGASAIILKGVVIGEGSVIGAGSVVTKSIEPYSVAVGNPCVVIKQRFNETKNVEHKTQS
jgi:acetyltransferase-like isoleucine patch superfamily enzyme